MYVFVNIGSNVGDRRMNLSRALRAIVAEYGMFEVSHSIESEPWGFASKRKFLNMGLMFQTDENPQDVLTKLQSIEKSICDKSHRDDEGNYIDRIIDIDIVAIDNLVIDTPELKVPHPHLPNRKFFLHPMNEIAPDWKHPINGKTAAEMLIELSVDESKN